MKVAVIPTVPMLGFTRDQSMHMILPYPLQHYSKYKQFYDGTEGYRILDNGEAEGMKMPVDELMAIAERINAHEIVVPDVIGDKDQTVMLAREFQKVAKAYPEFNYMGVLQGQTHKEYMECFVEFLRLGYITTLGVPRVMNKILDSPWCRAGMVETLMNGTVSEHNMQLHCLGASRWIREVAVLSELPVRSLDSSLPFVLGLEGIDIRKGPYVDRKPGFFAADGNISQREQILINIDTYREWAGDYQETPGGVL